MSVSKTSLQDMLDVEHGGFLVQFDINSDADALTTELATAGVRAVRTITPASPDEGRGPLLLVEMVEDQAPEQAIQTLSRIPGVAFAELNASVSIMDMNAGDHGFVGPGVRLASTTSSIPDLPPTAIAEHPQADILADTSFSRPVTGSNDHAASDAPAFGGDAETAAAMSAYAPSDTAGSSMDGMWVMSEAPELASFTEAAWAGPSADAQMSVTIDAVSNDTAYNNGNLWGMYGDKTSIVDQFGSQAGEAWAAGFTGSMKTVVGVVDTGIDYTHPDLYLNVWLNQGEISTTLKAGLRDTDGDGLITFRDLNNTVNAAYVTDLNRNGYIDAGDLLKDARWANGTDQDGNGYKDDLIGWDFVNNDNDPFDDNGHGTHVSGTIGAMGGNGTGVVGVDWNVQIVAMKFLNASGSGAVDGAVQAINYFTHESQLAPTSENFVATNNSWGGGGFSQALSSAVTLAAQNDILFIAAAGNSSVNTDTTANYPSNLSTMAGAGYDAVVSVASLTSSGALSSFSDYGAATVDLAAPGSSIYSTLPGGGYGTYSGTSMATPHVTGAVALYASANPTASAAQIKTALLASTDSTASVNGLTLTGGRLDVGNLLTPSLQPLDIAGGTSTTASLGTASPQSSTIDGAGDQDWFRVSLTSGNRYDFTMSPSAGSSLDCYLRLLDSNGTPIAFNDDPVNATSHISYSATNGGTFYISAQGTLSSIGAYTLSVTAAPAPTVISGTSGNDLITGGALNETLYGYAGNDTIDGGAGADTMIGAIGDDVYYVDNSNDVIVEVGSQGTDSVFASASFILNANVENLTLTGSASIYGFGNNLDNMITGNSGDNIIDGGAGADTMTGGAGNDIYVVDNVGDMVVENALSGNDGVYSSISYTLAANVEGLALTGSASINGTGNSLNNTIYGNNANNVLDGAAGADTLIGCAGNDTYVVDNVGDYVLEDIGGGTDIVMASISYMLTANVENLTLTGATAINGYGNSLDNVLTGNAGANYLDGGAGNDSLIGGAGNDTLTGGAGNDTLDGGAGADFFRFNSAPGTGNIDRIMNFSVADDTIYLDLSVFTAFGKLGPIASGAFNTGSVATEADDRIIFNKATGDLFYDADGSGRGAAVQFATIVGLTGVLSSQDFILI